MYQGNCFSRFSIASLLVVGLLSNGVAFSQTKSATLPDAQIEANVLKALAGAPELADQSITSTTVYGTVTLNGMVRDEPLRDLAEHLVANTTGVQKVVDQLTIGAPAANDSDQAGSNPNLRSDGTIAPPQEQNSQVPGPPSPQSGAPPQQTQYPQPQGGVPQQGQYPPPNGAPPQAGQ